MPASTRKKCAEGAEACRRQWVRSAQKRVQWTLFSGERAIAAGGSPMSKGVQQAKAKMDDYCELRKNKMTDRLYYDDAYCRVFDAQVTACREGRKAGQWEIALDRSAFYPTSGGQPFDTGTLLAEGREVPVTDVGADGAGEVWHTVAEPLPVGTSVRGNIDWARRTDHMEQRAGEHMLSGAI